MRILLSGALAFGFLLGCGGGGETSGASGAGGAGGASSSSNTASATGTGGASSTSSSSTGAGGGGSVSDSCAPLPAPTGNIINVTPADVGKLPSIVYDAKTGDTILLEDGTYDLAGAFLQFPTAGVSLRSKSGDPSKVILDGSWQSNEICQVVASDVTIAEVTLQRAINHPIHVVGASNADVNNTMIYNVVVKDPGEQAIKINTDGSHTHFADKGTIACSTILMTSEGRSHVMNNCYTGGVDAHDAAGWVIRDNFISGFWCPSGLSEHGIHLWTGSRDTVVERNVITECARGIGFGLGSTGQNRTFSDNPCPGVASAGHYKGVIANNFIYASDPGLWASQSGFDTGIGLEQACGAVVMHNTIVATQAPFASIDSRFGNSDPMIVNNLMSHSIVVRDGSTPAANQGNLEKAPSSLFADASKGDLHLQAGASAAIDQGAVVAGATAKDDIDGDLRDGKPDIGADEVK